ncbi:MAG: Zn-ribbon domain-containing protein [Halanaeroarchaeum sp.]
MPHQCTTCGQAFPDGSKEMLSGCPECGGNKFQYLPSDALSDSNAADQPPADDPPGRDPDDAGVTEAVGRAATTVRDYVSRNRSDDSPGAGVESDAEAMPSEADDEDEAQASARGEIVDPSDLPDEPAAEPEGPPGEGRVVKKPDSQESLERPELDELRQELNEQFESIRIVAPGQYELNLMELYDREEHIIALQEDGRYIIEVPDTWRDEE